MTATWRTREELIHQLVTLHRQGLSCRALARALGVSRNTVKVLRAAHTAARETEHEALAPPPSRAPRASKLDAYRAHIKDLLDRYPDITAQRVFETLREQGFPGGYTAVKKSLRRLRPPPRPEPSLATPEYGPGEMAESDWSPYDVRYTDGQKDKVQAFSYVLVYSRRKYLDLYRHADFFGLMDDHVQAFARFGGCAHRCT
jgi:transposase